MGPFWWGPGGGTGLAGPRRQAVIAAISSWSQVRKAAIFGTSSRPSGQTKYIALRLSLIHI